MIIWWVHLKQPGPLPAQNLGMHTRQSGSVVGQFHVQCRPDLSLQGATMVQRSSGVMQQEATRLAPTGASHIRPRHAWNKVQVGANLEGGGAQLELLPLDPASGCSSYRDGACCRVECRREDPGDGNTGRGSGQGHQRAPRCQAAAAAPGAACPNTGALGAATGGVPWSRVAKGAFWGVPVAGAGTASCMQHSKRTSVSVDNDQSSCMARVTRNRTIRWAWDRRAVAEG
jgi:hypothetical protein